MFCVTGHGRVHQTSFPQWRCPRTSCSWGALRPLGSRWQNHSATGLGDSDWTRFHDHNAHVADARAAARESCTKAAATILSRAGERRKSFRLTQAKSGTNHRRIDIRIKRGLKISFTEMSAIDPIERRRMRGLVTLVAWLISHYNLVKEQTPTKPRHQKDLAIHRLHENSNALDDRYYKPRH